MVAGVAGAQIERVSVRSDGKQANDQSSGPATNEDGSCVAFWSDASNLLPAGPNADTNGATDVFVYYRWALGAFILVMMTIAVEDATVTPKNPKIPKNSAVSGDMRVG